MGHFSGVKPSLSCQETQGSPEVSKDVIVTSATQDCGEADGRRVMEAACRVARVRVAYRWKAGQKVLPSIWFSEEPAATECTFRGFLFFFCINVCETDA